jgi:hypothetical protein
MVTSEFSVFRRGRPMCTIQFNMYQRNVGENKAAYLSSTNQGLRSPSLIASFRTYMHASSPTI